MSMQSNLIPNLLNISMTGTERLPSTLQSSRISACFREERNQHPSLISNYFFRRTQIQLFPIQTLKAFILYLDQIQLFFYDQVFGAHSWCIQWSRVSIRRPFLFESGEHSVTLLKQPFGSTNALNWDWTDAACFIKFDCKLLFWN